MTANQYKKLRKKLGTQQEVAELLGVTRQLIGMRESGAREITKEAELAIRSIPLGEQQQTTKCRKGITPRLIK